MNKSIAAALVLGCAGCVGVATNFRGEAKVMNGPAGCRAICQNWNMEMAGMIQFGEYSDACVCEVRRDGDRPASASFGGTAAAGVIMQMRALEQQEQMNQQLPPEPPPVIDVPPPMPMPMPYTPPT